MGVQALGLGLARLLKEMRVAREVVVGHDFRSYSASVKLALTAGLMAGGAHVRDIGLALTPMAYFAQFALNTPAVAMVTASHNDNGWTGVKMGAARPVTFGPEEMARLRDIVIAGDYGPEAGGGYEFIARLPGPLHRRSDQPAEIPPPPQGRRRLRQRDGWGVRAQALERARRRGRSSRLRTRLHVPALQSEPRGHADAARDGGGGEGGRRRPRARLRRRRRPLRSRRQRGPGDFRRQDRGHARARPVDAPPRRDLRRRRQVDRAVRDRSRASRQWRQGRFLEDRPFAHQAAGPGLECARRLREIGAFLLQRADRPGL